MRIAKWFFILFPLAIFFWIYFNYIQIKSELGKPISLGDGGQSLYSAPKRIFKNQIYSPFMLESFLNKHSYSPLLYPQELSEKNYWWPPSPETCSYIDSPQLNPNWSCTMIAALKSTLVIAWDLTSQDSDRPVFIGELDNFKSLSPKEVIFLDPDHLINWNPLLKEVSHQPTPLGQIPPSCLQALMAIEDQRFLEHQGFDPAGLLRALFTNLQKARLAQGGSTLTQQYIKNAFLTQEKTFSRKFKEILMAIALEQVTDKDQILSKYLDIVYYGSVQGLQLRGINSASEYFFNKSPESLELEECALLAGMLKAPSYYNPFLQPIKSKARRDLVLTQMRNKNYITDFQLKNALNKSLPQASSKIGLNEFGYYLDFIKTPSPFIENSNQEKHTGRIDLSLDLTHQKVAQEHLKNHIQKLKNKNPSLTQLNGAVIVVERATQWVTAFVGGSEFTSSPFNRALLAKRQIGSLIKPFIYYLALKNDPDLTPDSLIEDQALIIKSTRPHWKPLNYDKKFHGQVTLTQALAQSYNIPAVKLGIKVGPDLLSQLFNQMLPELSLNFNHPSSFLGAIELTPFEVIKLYSFLDPLKYSAPIQEFELLPKPLNSNAQPLLETPYNEQITQMLMTAALEGTSQLISKKLKSPSGGYGKTGTTSNSKDVWFVGYSPHYLALVWLGDDNNKSLKQTGGSAALPLWIDIINDLEDNF